jgi:hypothetical protein
VRSAGVGSLEELDPTTRPLQRGGVGERSWVERFCETQQARVGSREELDPTYEAAQRIPANGSASDSNSAVEVGERSDMRIFGGGFIDLLAFSSSLLPGVGNA